MGFATTISQLTQQSGIDAAEARREQAKIAAAALTSNAEAQSHAAAAKGAIWGSAISNIGQSIGEIPAQMAKTKALNLQAQDVQAQIDERRAHAAKVQQEDAENQQVDRAFQESLRPDGTVDLQAFSSKIPGSKQQVYLPLIEKVNAAAEADKQKKESVAAHAFFSAYKGGTPASLVTAAKMGVAAKAMTPEDLQQIQQIAGAIASGPVEAQEGSTRTLAAHLGSHFPQFQDLLDADTGKQAATAHVAAQTKQANAEADYKAAQTAGTLPPTPDQQQLVLYRQRQIEEIDAKLAGKVPLSPKDAAELQIQRDRLAAEQKHWNATEADKKKATSVDIGPDVQTTASGKKYIDGSSYQGESRNRAHEAANTAGVTMVSKEQANALQEIDNARANQKSIIDQISGSLPKDPSGRPLAAASTALAKIFQTDEQKAAFSSWRSAAIQTLRATAGSKGLRINQAEIAMAIENDIPKLTDTVGVAQQKVKNIGTMLDNAESSIVVKDRSAPSAEPMTRTAVDAKGNRSTWTSTDGGTTWHPTK